MEKKIDYSLKIVLGCIVAAAIVLSTLAFTGCNSPTFQRVFSQESAQRIAISVAKTITNIGLIQLADKNPEWADEINLARTGLILSYDVLFEDINADGSLTPEEIAANISRALSAQIDSPEVLAQLERSLAKLLLGVDTPAPASGEYQAAADAVAIALIK